MRILFVNDTSGFHCGSDAVCSVIHEGLRTAGHEVRTEKSRIELDLEGVEACDAVLVNGEGTLHDDSPRSHRILELLEHAQTLGRPTAICNASWFAMSSRFDHVLRRLDSFEVRERLSHELLHQQHGVRSVLRLDLSYFHPARPNALSDAFQRVKATDLYWPGVRGFVRPTGGQLARFGYLSMEGTGWSEFLDEVASCEVLLTGRHHGVYAACRARTPFVALGGNTPKIEGLAAWSGLDLPVTRDPALLAGMVATIRRHRDSFSRLFDWMEAQPVWSSPF